MGNSNFSKTACFLLVLMILSLACNQSLATMTRKLTSLYQSPPMSITYHKGPLLQGNLPISIMWYGQFTPAQKSIIADFLLSLNPTPKTPSSKQPTVSHWWNLVQTYLKKAGKSPSHIEISTQIIDDSYSLGKLLKRPQVTELANKVNAKPGGLILVLTSQDVAVEGFCMSNCGFHRSNKNHNSAFVWVGNSVTQCPGQCAWPFHRPMYGPQTPPLVAPNGDVGVDGMIINIASLLAGAVTNPFGNGYYLGSAAEQLEVASACPGVYGKGAYPGYTGEVQVDPTSGASYNAVGANGRKYLLPAIFDPLTSQCSTLG